MVAHYRHGLTVISPFGALEDVLQVFQRHQFLHQQQRSSVFFEAASCEDLDMLQNANGGTVQYDATADASSWCIGNWGSPYF